MNDLKSLNLTYFTLKYVFNIMQTSIKMSFSTDIFIGMNYLSENI